ncbi:MAG TPA: Hsp20/alpha crystallin family protein, partial [Candidatus Binatia bacterium]|nr:Hsp20/alpha crystallin family protein [Candidatus Binatia bacterium]
LDSIWGDVYVSAKRYPREDFMDLVRWEPFEGLSRIQNRINDLFDDTFGRARASMPATGVWFPPVDILESRDSYLIRAELPGMKREDFNLEVHDGSLTISGERKFEEAANGVEYHRVERASGKFSRSFYLPQTVKTDAIKATYRDGILEIHVPKADEAKPKQITISVK